MKTRLVSGLGMAIFLLAGVADLPARDITAPELASFLGVSSWETRVMLPQKSYVVDICPIEDGKVGKSLIEGQIDWSKDPEGRFVILAGPAGDNYRFTLTSRTGGSLGVSPEIPRFANTYSPSLPAKVEEGVFILFVDAVGRDPKGGQNDPATYKRGFVLKVTKKN